VYRQSAISFLESIAQLYSVKFEDVTLPLLLEKVNCEQNPCCVSVETSALVLGECAYVNKSICEKVMARLLLNLSIQPVHLHTLKSIGRVIEQGCVPSKGGSWFIPLIAVQLCGLEKLRFNAIGLVKTIRDSTKFGEMKQQDQETWMKSFDIYLMILRRIATTMDMGMQKSLLLQFALKDPVRSEMDKYSVRFWFVYLFGCTEYI